MNLILDKIRYRDKTTWEQTRFLSYIIAQVNSKKKLKSEDILKFPWDSENNSDYKEITPEELKQLQTKAEMLKNML